MQTLPDCHPGVKNTQGCCCCFCSYIVRHKCCTACLILLCLLIGVVVGVKIFINSILNEVEEESFNSNFKNSDVNGTLKTLVKKWEAPEDIRKGLRHTFSGFDIQHQPVWIIPFGKWDLKGLLTAKEENEKIVRKYADQCLERIVNSVTLSNTTKWVIIVDTEDYSYAQLTSLTTITFLFRMVKKYENIFHTLAHGFVVNLDFFSESLVTIVGPLFGDIMDRLELMGTDKDKYISAILNKIPSSQLPEEYGGSKGFIPVSIVD